MIRSSVRNVFDTIIRLLTSTDTTIGEFWGSTLLCFMGLWLILPLHTFATISVYHIMATAAPEAAWGAVILALGIAQAIGNIQRRQNLRRLGAFVASVLFGFVSALAMIAEPASLLAPICGVSSFVEGVIYLRLSLFGEGAARVQP